MWLSLYETLLLVHHLSSAVPGKAAENSGLPNEHVNVKIYQSKPKLYLGHSEWCFRNKDKYWCFHFPLFKRKTFSGIVSHFAGPWLVLNKNLNSTSIFLPLNFSPLCFPYSLPLCFNFSHQSLVIRLISWITQIIWKCS